MTVTASDETGIHEIYARWDRPSGLSYGGDLVFRCSPTVSNTGGTVTCTNYLVLDASHYSGIYQLNVVALYSPSTDQTYETEYYGPAGDDPGRLKGHGRGGVVGVSEFGGDHNLTMPSFTVE
jgi:hypothetical protein